MTTNPHAPKSIRLVHGMNHTGLTQSALEIERSREFKRAFVESIAAGIGFSGVDPEIVAGSEPSASLTAYLETFGPDGHPPESETLRFLSDELAFRGGPSLGVGEQLMDACFWTPEGWIVVGG